MAASESILITGAEGQLGRALLEAEWPRSLVPFGAGRSNLDITDEAAVRACFADCRFDGVINAAAYTHVDKAESDTASARAVNVNGPRILAERCRDANIPLLHVLTEFVFDGSKSEPYIETDKTNPLNAYGQSKLDGEAAVAQVWPKHIILRVSWSYSFNGRNFVATMLRRAEAGSDVSVVDDQIGAPTCHEDIAAALICILAHCRSIADAPWGIYHFANGGAASRYEVARRIFDALRAEGLTTGRVRPVRTSAYSTPAQRPLNSRLDTSKFQTTFSGRPAAWQDRLDEVIEDYCTERRKGIAL